MTVRPRFVRSRSNSVVLDTQDPVLSSLSVSAITNDGATISFTTDESATSELQYDDNSGFTTPTTIPVETVATTSHEIALTGLGAGNTVYARGRAIDQAGNISEWSSYVAILTTGGGGGESWADSGTLSGIVIGTPSLDATFNSIMTEVPITETTGTVASVKLEFRKTLSPATVRKSIGEDYGGAWIVRPTGAQAAAYEKLLFLDDNTSYDVRFKITDMLGLIAYRVGSITTREDNLPAAASLTPTHFLSPTGSDAANGTSALTPWKTINKARTSGPSGAIVKMAPGWYPRDTNARTLTPITFLAEYPAVDDDREVINAGNHSIVFEYQTGPTGAVDAHLTAVAPWTDESAVYGLPAGTIYKWVGGASRSGVKHMTVHSTLLGTPVQVAHWKRTTNPLDYTTHTEWVTALTTNQSFNYGFWTDSSGNIYVRMPPTAPSNNPNDMYVTMGGSSTATDRYGIFINAPNCRVSGLEFRSMNSGVQLGPLATFAHIDHILSYGVPAGARVYGTANGGSGSAYGSDHVIEYNRIIDMGMWTVPSPTKENTIPWTFIKGNIVRANGTKFATNKLGEAREAHGVDAPGGARRMVLRHNTVIGCFNCFGGNSNGFDRYANYGLDCHDSFGSDTADEFFEFETNAIGVAGWNNRAEWCKQFISTSPLNYGPQYHLFTSGYMCGAYGQPIWPAGSDNTPGSGGYNKYSPNASALLRPRVYFVNMTWWSNGSTPTGSNPSARATGGGSSVMPDVLEINCLYRVPGRVNEYEEDMNRIWPVNSIYASASAATEGFKLGGTVYRTLAQVATWRAAILAAGGHNVDTSQRLNGVDIAFEDEAAVDDVLTAPFDGDLTTKIGSAAIAAGVTVHNVLDRPGVDYAGAAPNLGYTP